MTSPKVASSILALQEQQTQEQQTSKKQSQKKHEKNTEKKKPVLELEPRIHSNKKDSPMRGSKPRLAVQVPVQPLFFLFPPPCRKEQKAWRYGIRGRVKRITTAYADHLQYITVWCFRSCSRRITSVGKSVRLLIDWSWVVCCATRFRRISNPGVESILDFDSHGR